MLFAPSKIKNVRYGQCLLEPSPVETQKRFTVKGMLTVPKFLGQKNASCPLISIHRLKYECVCMYVYVCVYAKIITSFMEIWKENLT